jgi:choline dehydrogenase
VAGTALTLPGRRGLVTWRGKADDREDAGVEDAWDYIVVGGGSTGCVLANRLSADPATRVLLLEAGGDNKSILIAMPKGFGKALMKPEQSWAYPLEPHEGAGNAPAFWLGGRGLGGGSAVNGVLYVRGDAADYEAWAEKAGPEWGWARMKQAFRSIERHELGDDGNRGVAGPVGISVNRLRSKFSEALIEAGVQMGLPRREDLNGEDQEGVGYYAQNIWKGRRVTSANAFLDPIRRRRNLTVVTGAEVERIGFEGSRATSVHARLNGAEVVYRSRGEIIVSCGTVGSPALLQRSGVGPAPLLTRLGIPLVADLPVGRHLNEQFTLVFVHRLRGFRGYSHLTQGLGLVRSVLGWALFRRGFLANCAWDVGLYLRSKPELARPDLQFEVGPFAVQSPQLVNGKMVRRPMPFPAMTIYGYLNQLDSEGVVEIPSANPAARPRVTPNFFATENDRQAAINMVRLVRRYCEMPALRPYVGEEVLPLGGDADEEILATVRREGLAGLHATGTCAMGRDPGTVVDERLAVRGVSGLRVADCSVMPRLISGNTNGPAMALGWRAADLILEDRQGAMSAA